MTRENDTLDVVREVLRQDDPRLRSNAVVALAAIRSSESCWVFAERALAERDPSVRERFLDELSDMPDAQRATVEQDLWQELKIVAGSSQTAPEHLLAADAFLRVARERRLLRSRPDWDWRLRLKVSGDLRRFGMPQYGVWDYFTAARAGIIGGFFGVALLIVGLAQLDPPVAAKVHWSTILSGGLLSLAYGVLGIRTAQPIERYFDRAAAGWREALWFLTDPGLLGLSLATAALPLGIWAQRFDVPFLKTVGLGGGAWASILALLVLIRAVQVVIGWWVRNALLRNLLRTLLGSVAGLAGTMGLFIGLWALRLVRDASNFFCHLAAVMLPVSIGLAFALGRLIPGPSRRSTVSHLGLSLSSAAILLSIPLLGWLVSRTEVAVANGDTVLEKTWSLDDVPAVKRLRVDTSQAVEIELDVPPGSGIGIWLRTAAGRTLNSASPRQRLWTLLDPGEYRVEVLPLAGVDADGSRLMAATWAAFVRLADRFLVKPLGGTRMYGVVPYHLRVALNVGHGDSSADEHLRRYQRLLKEGEVGEAVVAFRQAVALEPLYGKSPVFWDHLCRSGSIHGGPAGAWEVLDAACSKAVELASEDARAWESRGIARAFVGDLTGAIEDLQHAEALAPNPPRQRWLAALERGENPFEREDVRAQLGP